MRPPLHFSTALFLNNGQLIYRALILRLNRLTGEPSAGFGAVVWFISSRFGMAAVIPLASNRSEHKSLLTWMDRALKERERVMASPDEESVHDLRVALRRCRSLASVFEEVDPHPAWRELRKSSRKLFKSLGVIRDSQVQEAWLLKLGSSDDPLRGQILYALKADSDR